MTQQEIEKMVEAQRSQYKAMGLDEATINSMMLQLKETYKAMYGNNAGNLSSSFATINAQNPDGAYHSNNEADDENEECNLTEAQKYVVACSYILAIMNDEDTYTLASGDEESSQEKLSNWWGLNSKQELDEKIYLVLQEGHRIGFAQDSDSRMYISELAHIAQQNNINAPKEIAAWDYCRVISLYRWAIDVGYYSEEEAFQKMLTVAKKIQKTYPNWQDMGMAYLLGRAYWGSEPNIMEDGGFINTYQAFVNASTAEDSFWNTVAWNTNLFSK